MLTIGFLVFLFIACAGLFLAALCVKKIFQVLWFESLKVALRITEKIKKRLDSEAPICDNNFGEQKESINE